MENKGLTNINDAAYQKLIDNITTLWGEAKSKAIAAVNTELLDANWQTDNGMQVEISKQLGLDGYLCVVCSKQETVWDNDRCTTILLQTVHDENHEEVGSLTTAHI